MKLGEVLIAEGVISSKQLKDGLDTQLRYGGHLGTVLIEIGYLTEERLGQALARASGVPYAQRSTFQSIPRSVISALPKRIVQKHSTIPLGIKDNALDVAMIDPKNLQAVDEIRFVSGSAIRCWIAPEMRIFQAMERYYGIPRRSRYVTLCRSLDKDRPEPVEAESPSSDHLDSGRRAASNEDWLITSPAAGTMARSAVAAASIATADPLVAVSELLCGAKTEDQIADLVLDAMRQDVPRRVLFKVQGSSAYVWRSAGAAIDSDATSIVRFPILSESIFGLLHGDDYYAGPLPSDPVHLGFYRKLGIDAPARILVLPVHLDDQLIAMFYGDGGGDGTVGGSVEHHRRLLVKAALAVNVVRTKQKIRAV